MVQSLLMGVGAVVCACVRSFFSAPYTQTNALLSCPVTCSLRVCFFSASFLCRGECVRLRHFVTNSFVEDNVITNCGIFDYEYDNGGKNGEAVYMGTSSKQVRDGRRLISNSRAQTPPAIRDNQSHDLWEHIVYLMYVPGLTYTFWGIPVTFLCKSRTLVINKIHTHVDFRTTYLRGKGGRRTHTSATYGRPHGK